ncbi:hypothetical protein Acy02nite_56540 [Actinoplanes cyaneus]|uniref:DUF2079 domain-containing protein n=1 Tax=Actinoplanes cyaneus TaxID=52696 RepID=A0A919ILV1_9ACTN|nr:DUF2079 domain-containing protein [Actinoplanes cyaneus]MCW2139932.1 putative membrane protein [Actinoplanes cyaneus]GID67773.1 hypothetical protein Acy02nite_56540 [Actinoplanes cyaneus]
MQTTVVRSPETTRLSAAPYVVAAALFLLYTCWSVHRHRALLTRGYDLGIFEQAVRGYAGPGAPTSTIKGPGFNLLGDHFHPILALLAPLYRVFPGPVTLLVAQAALLAVSSIPVTALAGRVAGFGAAVSAGIAYGMSWGLQSAVDFDFHEVAFAVPLLAFSLVAFVERRWVAAAGWAVPLIAVKEDLPATVAVIGMLLVWRGRRRLGVTTIVVAVGSGLLIVGVLLPALNPTHVYAYAGSTTLDGQDPLQRLFLPATKIKTLLWLLAPTLFLALRSPLFLVAAPTLVWRFWSANPSYWGTGFQYSAVLMPIVFVAFLDALPERRARAAAHAACVIALAATMLAPLPLRGLLDPGMRGADAVRLALARIPDDARVAADNRLAPQLTSRCEVYFFPAYPQIGVLPEWVAVSDPPDTSMATPGSMGVARDRLPALGYQVVLQDYGVTVYRR